MRCLGHVAVAVVLLFLSAISIQLAAAQGSVSAPGELTRPPGFLGAQLSSLTPELADDLGMPGLRGVLVNWPVAGLPAAEAGVMPLDVAVTLDDTALESAQQLVDMVGAKGAGARVDLKVLRGGEFRRMSVLLGKRPPQPLIPQDLQELLARRDRLYEKRDAEATLVAQEAQKRIESVLGHEHLMVAQGLLQLGELYAHFKSNADAEATLLKARGLFEKLSGPNSPKLSDVYMNLGKLYERLERFSEAETAFRAALEIRERISGRAHSDVASALYAIASLLKDRGDFKQAEALAQRAAIIQERAFGPDDERLINSLHLLGNIMRSTERNAEAAESHRRALTIAEKRFGATHVSVANALYSLANDLLGLHLHQEAVTALNRALQIYETNLGLQDLKVANVLNLLAAINADQGRYEEAMPLYLRSLAMREVGEGPESLAVAESLNNLGNLYVNIDRLTEGEAALRRSLAIYAKKHGREDGEVANAMHNLAISLRLQARFHEAEAFYLNARGIRERLFGPGAAVVADSYMSLGSLYSDQGRYVDAEANYRRGIDLREQLFGPNDQRVANGLNDLGALFSKLKRFSEAIALHKRALEIREGILGSNPLRTTDSLVNLALVYSEQKRYDEALQHYARALTILEKLVQPDHTKIGHVLDGIANVHNGKNDFALAEPYYQRALAIRERAHGPEHPSVGLSLHNLAVMFRRQGRYDEAIQYGERRLAISQKAYGAGHPDVANSHWFLGHVFGLKHDWQRAREHSAIASAYWVRRANPDEIAIAKDTFYGHVRSTVNFAERAPARAEALHREAFLMAQRASQTEAATAVTRMAARAATTDPSIARLARERQDLADRRIKADKALVATLSVPGSQRKPEFVSALRTEVAQLDALSGALDDRLKREFPNFAALARPEPVDTAAVQKLLRPDEVLVAFSLVVEEGYAWLITPYKVRGVRLPQTSAQLQEMVHTLKCGLDAKWNTKYGQFCRRRTGVTWDGSAALPFNLAQAHELYKVLFGAFDSEIRNRKLLLVLPPGLSDLPFNVLVTERPRMAPATDSAGYKNARWLGLRQPLTVWPSAAALKAVREQAKQSRADRPYLGIANPLLDGWPDNAPHAEAAVMARAWQHCSDIGKNSGGRSRFVLAGPPAATSLFRGGLADVDAVRQAPPLPETAEEVCEIARQRGATEADILLGQRASEAQIKEMSSKGDLARHRVLHFATHGIVAGEFKDFAEPALILTPPKTATELDDGLLTSSEVATLKLDADWVILSACNTAAPLGQEAGEALSGLARSFFYAGARSLLVSHWEVVSIAAVELVTGAFEELRRNPRIGRSEAVQRAMWRLVSRGGDRAHPAYWAPFAIVGEGAATVR